MMRKLIFFILSTSLCFTANANDKKIHPQLAKEAVRQFNKCFLDSEIPKKLKKKFIAYTEHEDNLFRNGDRIRHWHFFSPEGDLGKSKSGAHISMDTRFKKLEAKLHKEINKNNSGKRNLKNIYETIGRITHYLQDVTSPAHVMPIYHWTGKKDAFDGYPFNADKASNYFTSKQGEICAIASEQNEENLFAILTDTAKATIHASHNDSLTIKNGTRKDATWGLFWKQDKNCKECGKLAKYKFKDYGPFGNSFGDNEIFDRCDLEEGASPYDKYCGGSMCIIEPPVYAEFAEIRHREAIMATLKALYYVKIRLNRAH